MEGIEFSIQASLINWNTMKIERTGHLGVDYKLTESERGS